MLQMWLNPLNPELNPICYLLELLAHHFLHVSRIRVKSLTLRLLMSYIYIYIYIYDISSLRVKQRGLHYTFTRVWGGTFLKFFPVSVDILKVGHDIPRRHIEGVPLLPTTPFEQQTWTAVHHRQQQQDQNSDSRNKSGNRQSNNRQRHQG